MGKKLFQHQHPYSPFIPGNATKLIVGTLPPPRFTQNKRKPGDVDFCYGSRDGQLWKILERIFEVELIYEDCEEAVRQRKDFLIRHKVGICDMVESAEREKIDATDVGMKNAKLRNMIGILKKHPQIQMILFTGGNSKNGPEYFFRKHIRNTPIKLELIDDNIPRIHQFELEGRIIKTVSLTAPSGSANRAVGSMPLYKKIKAENPDFNVLDFRVLQYSPFFLEKK